MAEAVVEDRTQQTLRRFYCHKCGVEVDHVTNEFKCPLCAGGFIEELPANTNNGDTSSTSDVDMLENDPNDSFTLFEGLSSRLSDELSTFLMPMTGGRPPQAHDDDENAQNPSGSNNGGGGGLGGGGGGGGGSGGAGGRHFGRRIDSFNVLQDFLISVTGGGTPMFFMGNPGDYAWGREGLDTIVTQLLNQMDTTGPPPLPKDQIQEIPKVEITQDQVDIKLQCSVCWEDFRLSETVRKLSCSHVYHDNCIVPWLELHGTCPVCRKSFVPEYTEEQQRNQLSTSTANSLRHVARTLLNQENNENNTNTRSEINPASTPSSQHLNQQQQQIPHPLQQHALQPVTTPYLMRGFPYSISTTQPIALSLNRSPSTSSTTAAPQQQHYQTVGTIGGSIGTPGSGAVGSGGMNIINIGGVGIGGGAVSNSAAGNNGIVQQNNTAANNSSRRNASDRDEVEYEYD